MKRTRQGAGTAADRARDAPGEHGAECASGLDRLDRLREHPQPRRPVFWWRVRYVLTRRLPAATSILLVESGSRYLFESVIAGIRGTWGNDIFVDLVTPYPGLPEGFSPHNTRVYRVTDYRGREGRRRLYRELARNRYSILGIICSSEPVMTKWKWALALRIPAKIFVLNENGDYFWLDRGHWAPIRQFVLFRAGLAGAGAVRTVARLLLFPFTLLFLLLYATVVHARRAWRVRRGLIEH